MVTAGGILSRQIQISENIAALLPDDHSEIRRAFFLLNRMPLSRKIVITLKAGPKTSTTKLLDASRELARNLGRPYFTRAVPGPDLSGKRSFFTWILDSLPNLITASDLKRIDASLTPEGIRQHLERVRQRVLSPSGIAEKALLRSDPLNLITYGLEKFAKANPIAGLRLSAKGFLSKDGKNALILADTPVEGTDFKAGKRLIEELKRQIALHVPPGIDTHFIGVHRYTTANAEVMKADVWRVIGLSTALLLLLFLLFLPHWRAAFVFLVPVFSLVVASAAVSLAFTEVSALTLGFGAVLLGISVDFGLHVYFAVRMGHQDPASTLDQIARPVVFSALTTLSAFGVLLFSNLPGQRQMAVFAMAGLVFALGTSLVVLPHLIKPSDRPAGRSFRWIRFPLPARRKAIVGAWTAALVLGLLGMRHLRFNGDLGAINRVPRAVLKAEEEVEKTWGAFRRAAMMVCQGSTLEKALERNDRLFARLQQETPVQDALSLAPVFPSQALQKVHRRLWRDYWTRGKGASRLVALRAEAASMGFSPQAFKPFFDRLRRQAAPVTLETFSAHGVAPLLESLLTKTEKGFSIATLVPDTPEVLKTFHRIQKRFPDLVLVSQSRFREIISSAISNDFKDFLIRATAATLLLAALLFRRLKPFVLALVPAASGTVTLLGGMAALGLEFNLFNVVAAILVMGLSIDYGIFMVFKLLHGERPHTERAIFVSGLTTLSGFAALACARHPALSSIGVTVVLGIGGAIPSALWVVPSLYHPPTKAGAHGSP